VVAILGTGSELDRAVAVACAEAGADIALGTESDARDQDYGMNSIANEIWAIGREHLVRVLKGPDDIGDFVRDTRARLGGCDVLVCRFELSEVEGVRVVHPSAWPELTLNALLERFAG
jgi:NAD(P)-dependent dehydrogenase (short-subunit alcohol dehydrogenase family)